MNKQTSLIDYYDKTRWDYRQVWNVRNNFSLHFGYYDETATKHDAAVLNMNRQLADWAGIKAGDHVLDAGCGVGGSSIWLARERSATAVGITLAASQVQDAEQNALKTGVTGVVFKQESYLNTSFADETFDIVWAIESQCHAPNKADFYKEAYRVLKKGGQLVVADYIRKARPVSAEGEAIMKIWFDNIFIPDIDTQEEHKNHALKAGFTDFEVQDVTQNVRISFKNIYEHCTRWIKLAKVLNKFNLVSDIRIGNAEGTIAQVDAINGGYWFYALVKAVKND
jgi:tocopherol O-methyltransferase